MSALYTDGILKIFSDGIFWADVSVVCFGRPKAVET